MLIRQQKILRAVGKSCLRAQGVTETIAFDSFCWHSYIRLRKSYVGQFKFKTSDS